MNNRNRNVEKERKVAPQQTSSGKMETLGTQLVLRMKEMC